MKLNFLLFSIIIAVSVVSSVAISLDSKEQSELQQHYASIFAFAPKDYADIIKLYAPLEDSMKGYLEEAIQCHDEIIEQYVVSYLFWRTMPYGSGGALQSPPREQLNQIRQVSGLREYLFLHADGKKPVPYIFSIIAILYGDEPSVVRYLIERGFQGDAYACTIIKSLWTAGICSDLAEPIVTMLLQSEQTSLLNDALLYIEHCPSLSALPYLMMQLKKKEDELHFAGIPNFEENFTRPQMDWKPDISTAVEPPASEEIFRMLLLRVLSKYPVTELMPYKDDVLQMRGYISFGSMSGGLYESLVNRLTLDDQKFEEIISEEER